MEHEAPPTGALPYNTVPTVVTVALELGLATSTTLKRVGCGHTWYMSQTSSSIFIMYTFIWTTKFMVLLSCKTFFTRQMSGLVLRRGECQTLLRHCTNVPMYHAYDYLLKRSPLKFAEWYRYRYCETKDNELPFILSQFPTNASMCEPLPEVQRMNLVKYKQKSKIVKGFSI